MSKVRRCFRMKLYKGCEEEYEKRHNNLWAEMKEMIHKYGGSNYSIFLDQETNYLYGYIEVEDLDRWNKSSETEICRKWWNYMSDIMETNLDYSPVCVDLKSVFFLE